MSLAVPAKRPFDFAAKIFKYAAVVRVNYANSLTYASHLIARGAIVLLRIWIFTQLYTVTYAAAHTSVIGGMTVAMVIWSLMLTQSFQSSTRPYTAKLIDEEVKNGSIAYTLGKPYSYVLFNLFAFFGRLLPKLFTNVVIGSIAALVLIGPIRLGALSLMAALFLLVMGLILEFFMSLAIGLLAFWTEDTSAFVWIYSKGQLVFGGLVLPLALFPENIRRIVEYLPFAQLYYAPARLAVDFSSGLFVKFAIIQAAWVFVFVCVSVLIFRKGISHVSINGG